MESRSKKHHNTTPALDTPVLLSSPLPTNLLHVSPSSLFPLVSPPAIGGIFSIPVVSHQLVPSIQQKNLPMPSEPMILLPASALSFSSHSNFVISSPQQASQNLAQSLFHSLNAAQVPFLLNPSNTSFQVDQAFTAQQMNQQLFVLPFGSENVNATAFLDQATQSKSTCDHINLQVNKNNLSYAKKDSTHLSTDKCESQTVKPKVKNARAASTIGTKAETPAKTSILDDSINERNKIDIAQIISNIPTGWKVVGVTGLDQLGLGEILPSPDTPSPLLAINSNISTAEVDSNVKPLVTLTTEEIAPHDQPSLVSVNLNTTSQPVASETVFDKWPARELTCCVKMDDIPCTHMISIKTECMDGGDESSGNKVDRLNKHDHDNQQCPPKTSKCQPGLCCSKLETIQLTETSSRNASMSSCSISESSLLQKEPKTKSLDFTGEQNLFLDSKWTIIGITSMSPLPTTNTLTVSQVGTLAVGENSTSSVNPSLESIAIMNNVPVCSTIALTNENKGLDNSNKGDSCETISPGMLTLNNDNRSSSDIDLFTKSKPEDLKWTVVGIMESPVSNAPAAPISSSSLVSKLLRDSHPVTSSPIPSTQLQSVVNSQILSIMPTLSPEAAISDLVSTSSSPDQLSPNVQSKRQLKPQTTARKSPKLKSLAKNDNSQDDSHSQNQWKIVGVTQLGMPPPVASPIVSVSRVNTISPVISMPVLFQTGSGPLFSTLNTESTCIVTQTTNTTSHLLPSFPVLPSLFPQQALPFPVVNLNEAASCNTSLTLSSPSSILGAASAGIHTIQDLSQQHKLGHIIQNQLTACPNPINMLTINDSNQWNVVGIVANNQVSLLNSNQNSPSVSNAQTPEPINSTQEIALQTSVTSTHNTKSKWNSCSTNDTKLIKETPANKPDTIRQSLSTKREDSSSKHLNSKCKDMVNKCKDTAKIKKNTVSNLLRIKRMQQGAQENASSEDEDTSFEAYPDFADSSYEVPTKKTKTRSLRSYAGNRKIFTRTQNKVDDKKISLRSGTQIPVLSSKLKNECTDQALVISCKKTDERISPATAIESQSDDTSTGVMVVTNSSSRRRKLKVPRKLVADIDYHPFDSSSESS